MSYFYKIFFMAVVALSVVVGGRFDVSSHANGKQAAVITLSSDNADKAAEADGDKLRSSAAINPVAPGDSTTSSDNQAGGQSDYRDKNQNSNQAGVENTLDNSAILKPNSFNNLDAFRRIGPGQPPAVQAQSALVADLKTGQVYFSFNPALRWPTASLAKLMTAAVALKNINLNENISISSADMAVDGNQESTSTGFFKEGDVYSGNDLFAAMLLASKNEAAEALASAHGRGNFISEMNATAKELGMDSTNFYDPTGLSVSDQSSILDLKKLALNIYLNYPKIFETTKKKTAAAKELNSKKRTTIYNINTFAGTSGFIGGKTGYTDEAGGNLLSVFSYGGRPILIIVLGTDDRFGQTSNLLQWFEGNFQKN